MEKSLLYFATGFERLQLELQTSEFCAAQHLCTRVSAFRGFLLACLEDHALDQLKGSPQHGTLDQRKLSS